ncbi:MAG: hypothetical protein QME61_04305, partial [Patescibacteria group bacterium]|nr:hypothetical protein [Patescibacteria group bacterium]
EAKEPLDRVQYESIKQKVGISLEELILNKDTYLDKNITLEGFYFNGFHYQDHEVTILSQNLEQRAYKESIFKESSPIYERIFPDGIGIWVSDSFHVLEKKLLYQQVDPETNEKEYYGKIRAEGKFKECMECDDLGLYDYQIVLSEVEILSWSPNEAQKTFLKILYPNGGEKLKKGKTYEIVWKSTDLENEAGYVYLWGKDLKGIATGENLLLNPTPFSIKSGKYSFSIPAIVPPGNKYKLVITSTNCYIPREFCQQVFEFAKPSISDESDNYLSVIE